MDWSAGIFTLSFSCPVTGATAGLMIYITVDELIPNSCAGENHLTIFSFLAGVALVIVLGSL